MYWKSSHQLEYLGNYGLAVMFLRTAYCNHSLLGTAAPSLVSYTNHYPLASMEIPFVIRTSCSEDKRYRVSQHEQGRD